MPPGRTGCAGIDWLGSTTLRVDVGPGEVAHLRVQPGGSIVRLDQLFSRMGYLRLTADDGVAADEGATIAPRLRLVGLIGLPFALLSIFLVSYGVNGLLHHSRPDSWAAVVGGVALYVVPLVLARRGRRPRSEEK